MSSMHSLGRLITVHVINMKKNNAGFERDEPKSIFIDFFVFNKVEFLKVTLFCSKSCRTS